MAKEDEPPPGLGAVGLSVEAILVHVPVLNQEQLHRLIAACRDAIKASRALGTVALELLQETQAALGKWDGDPPPPPPAEPHLKVVDSAPVSGAVPDGKPEEP